MHVAGPRCSSDTRYVLMYRYMYNCIIYITYVDFIWSWLCTLKGHTKSITLIHPICRRIGEQGALGAAGAAGVLGSLDIAHRAS